MNLKLWEDSISEFILFLSLDAIFKVYTYTHLTAVHLFSNVIIDYSRKWCPKSYSINNHWIQDVVNIVNLLKMFPWPRLGTLFLKCHQIPSDCHSQIYKCIVSLFIFSLIISYVMSWMIIYKPTYPNCHVNKNFVTVDIIVHVKVH